MRSRKRMFSSWRRTWESTAFDPSVITTARDQERFAQPGCLILAVHLFDSGILLGGASERMPSDFFKTSRCSKSLAFSVRNRRFSASSSSTLRPDLHSLPERWLGAWAVPSDRAAVLEFPAQPLLWPRCVHWHAITPALPSCTPRCISYGSEPAYLTVFSCRLPFGF